MILNYMTDHAGGLFLPLIVMLTLAASKTVLEKIDRLRKLETRKARIVMDFALLAVGLLIFFT